MARKQRQEGKRAPNGASSVYYSEYSKCWVGRVTMGVRDDGKPDRRTVKRQTEGECIEAVQKLEAERANGNVRKAGRAGKVEKWLVHWVETIAPLTVRYKTLVGYRTAVYRHLIPGVGAHNLDKVEPDHFEKLYARMLKAGLSPATAHQVHRTARTAFEVAYKRGRITRNPVTLAKAPRVDENEIEPFEADETQRIIAAALRRRNGVRYVVALALGCRQGEALGFKWSRLDRKDKRYSVRSALQRQTWRHGCDDPHRCGEKHHKVKPCKENCKRHTRACPPACPSDCVSHARLCPQRHGGGLVEVPVKSRAGRRSLVLPDELYELLMKHEQVQRAEREHAGSEWQDGGWMFTQPNGRPIDPRQDLDEWKSILAEAGVRDARLHDARHTAATVLLLLGVDPRVVMAVMGWSTESMRKRYMHVTEELRRDVADLLNGYFWKAGEGLPAA